MNNKQEQIRRLSLRQQRQSFGWNKANLLAQRAIARHNLKISLTAADVCQIANEIGGKRWRAISFHNEQLKVIAADYESIAQLKMNERKLIAQINERLAEPRVKSLFVQLQWRDESASVQP